MDDPVDFGLAIGVSLFVIIICICTIISAFCYENRIRRRPREPSEETLV
jgi:hypothetical protein